MKKTMATACLLALAGMPAWADLSYKIETKVVGGQMAAAMRMATRMSKTARDAMNGSTYLKGNKMATRMGNQATVMDLDSETVTTIDHDKRQYSVVTFAEYQQAMQRLAEKVQGKKNDVQMDYSVAIDGNRKQQDVYGYPAKLTVMTMTVNGSDQKGNSGGMDMVNDLWLSTEVAGAGEMAAFSKRMAAKMASYSVLNLGMMSGMMQSQKGAAKAMEEFKAKAADLEGIPVLTVLRMAPAGSANALKAEAGKMPVEKADDADGDAPSVGSVLKGMGGFGGFGRKKNEPQPQTNSGGGSTMLELAMKQFDFSTAPVAESEFAVPDGYKQVENELVKQAR